MVERSNGTIIGGVPAHMMPSPMGWKARQQRANEKREQREDAAANIRLRQYIIDRDRARGAVTAAIESRDRLTARIASAQDLLAVHHMTMMQTGMVPPAMQSIKFAIEQSSALVEQAEAEITRTQSALDAAQRRLDDALAAEVEDDAEPQPEPQTDPVPAAAPARGRGRPAKVSL